MDSEDELFDFEDEVEDKQLLTGKSASFGEEDQSSADTDFAAGRGPSESPRSRLQPYTTEDGSSAQLGDREEQDAKGSAIMGTSMPISIPWTLKRKGSGPGEAPPAVIKQTSSTFIPPHKLSQANASYLEGSVPEMGARPIRQRNEFLRKTGFLEASTSGFTVSRVSTVAHDEYAQTPAPRTSDPSTATRSPDPLRAARTYPTNILDSSLSSALAPVSET